jgi:DoxX-like family
MDARSIAYWSATALIASETLAGGITDLIQGRESVVAGRPVVEVVTQLGYPVYVLRILGLLKLAGAVVMFLPRLPRLKEWAYAGVTFELTGAAASHVLRGNGRRDVITCLILTAFALASWALRPPSRTLGAVRAHRRGTYRTSTW